ncbi:uncharacterized protein B0H18DRAFT_1102817 [Fomitopsis serialis]|uniref:uncharacterized protein n=1 Tax=Fomitopsis serialis TaxID=139415 RepID=UPI0020088967|nr:uncharacterized protein B0H18DRAFT_1102817 [Neoantrodia serialis]KAH9931355.1 hypothetical protein B0H18DRAFT_1102817 [Neoantrodia serialis]
MATQTQPLRPAPAPLPLRLRWITIYHPGYTPPRMLFHFPTYDSAPAPHFSGCSRRLVLDACRIIAGNRDGVLSTTPDHRGPGVPESETTLTADAYYYFLIDDDDPQYAVVCEFVAWRFPDVVPAHWLTLALCPPPEQNIITPGFRSSGTSMSAVVKLRDGECLLSGYKQESSCDSARLVPKEQADWYYDNRMRQYNAGHVETPDDGANGVCLRTDIHRCLDRQGFVFFPVGSQFVAYFIKPEPDYASQYHRVPARIHEDLSGLSRFAKKSVIVVPSVDFQVLPAAYQPSKPSGTGKAKRVSATSSERSTPEEPADDHPVDREAIPGSHQSETFFTRFPQIPLKKAWILKNPQVRQTSDGHEGDSVSAWEINLDPEEQQVANTSAND